jgi:cell division protein FtsQ
VKRGAPRTPPRNPRLIAERPTKSAIRRRQLAKLAGPLSLLLVAGVLLIGVLGLSESSNPAGAMGQLRDRLGGAVGMNIAHVEILGQKQTPQALLDDALGAPNGTPLLNYQIEAARARLMQIPWIAQATVKRQWPDTLVVELTEHDAFAIWQDRGKFVLIDRTGKPLPDVAVANFKQLPLVVGDGAAEAAPALLEALGAEPQILKLLTAAVRVSDRRWNLELSNGATVLLPEGHEAAALTRLAALEATDRLLESPLAAIDMRQADKLVIAPRVAPTVPGKNP